MQVPNTKDSNKPEKLIFRSSFVFAKSGLSKIQKVFKFK